VVILREADILVNISIGIQIVLSWGLFSVFGSLDNISFRCLSVRQQSHKWLVSSCSTTLRTSTPRVSIFCSSSGISATKQWRFVFENDCFHRTPPGTEKSTRGQRKHSFEVKVDLAYIFHLFQFSWYIRESFQKSWHGSSPKKRFGLTNSASNILVRPTGATAPIGPVLFHHTYIGPVLVIPPRLFRGRDHLFTILPQHFLCHVPTAPATLLLKTVSFTTSTIHNVRDHRHNSRYRDHRWIPIWNLCYVLHTCSKESSDPGHQHVV
jgi:hypothetical protein